MSEALVHALQQQVKSLKLANAQASQVVARFMNSGLNAEQRQGLFELIVHHMKEQEESRVAQLDAVMRTAVFQLNDAAQKCTDDSAKQQIVDVIKALTLTVESSNLT